MRDRLCVWHVWWRLRLKNIVGFGIFSIPFFMPSSLVDASDLC